MKSPDYFTPERTLVYKYDDNRYIEVATLNTTWYTVYFDGNVYPVDKFWDAFILFGTLDNWESPQNVQELIKLMEWKWN